MAKYESLFIFSKSFPDIHVDSLKILSFVVTEKKEMNIFLCSVICEILAMALVVT